MDNSGGDSIASQMFLNVGNVLRKVIFSVLSVGPVPSHISFIMDGNRRYARKCKLTEGAGHNFGFVALISMLKYCYELGVKYLSVYAFSIDNYKRKPHEVQYLMNFMQVKMEELLEVEGIVDQFEVRIYFAGDLKLLSGPVREAAERMMAKTANNTKAVLIVCIAYTSTNEITNAIQKSCKEKCDETRGINANGLEGNKTDHYDQHRISIVDMEKHMYMAIAPEPDVLIRTSGETRLSNFLLWQSSYTLLYCPFALWPEISLRHLVWAVLNFQRKHYYLEKKKKQH